jgi:hypothetical protein
MLRDKGNTCEVLDVRFDGCGFSCSFDVLYEGLWISELQLLIKKLYIKFSALFFQFLVLKILDSG